MIRLLETVHHEGIEAIAVYKEGETDSCTGCAFQVDSCINLDCASVRRKDGFSVIFMLPDNAAKARLRGFIKNDL